MRATLSATTSLRMGCRFHDHKRSATIILDFVEHLRHLCGEAPPPIIGLVLLAPIMVPCLILHEIGHVIGAKLTGFEVFAISIGRGRLSRGLQQG